MLVVLVCAIGVLAAIALGSASANLCQTVTTCLSNGQAACDRTVTACPPCIYALQNQYTCWDKDNATNTCPFTGVEYDCSK